MEGGRRRTGGQLALGGFLFQLLRSLNLGLSLSASFAMDGGDVSSMTLTLEPDESGDVRMDRQGVSTIEQMKVRAVHRRWTTGIVAREVLPDLIAGARPGDSQQFRFTTDNLQGLETLRDYLSHRRNPESAPATFAWGSQPLTSDEFLAKIAMAAGVAPSDERLLHVLDRLSLVGVDVRLAQREVETLLASMLNPGESAGEKRHALMGRLFEAASVGQSITAAELLRQVGPDALLRLRLAATVHELSRAAVQRDCRILGYDGDAQARLYAIEAVEWFTVLSGESGQGKTWTLCQTALNVATQRAVVVSSSPGSIGDVIDALNERLWLPAFETAVSLAVLARRLGSQLALRGEPWLTIFVDDVQDRDFARRLAQMDWRGHGVQIVVTCQPRMTAEIVRSRPDAYVVQVANFTSTELRRYLRHHGRQDSLEIMPDDVFELLLKPVHARVYVELPARSGWDDRTEYELFKSYWDEATGLARDQYDHPYDRHRLSNLAGSLLRERPAYPWRWQDLEAVGFDEYAIRRLEVVGLLHRPTPDRTVFSTDRMLNWAVAEHLVSRVAAGELDAEEVDQLIDGFDVLVDSEGTPIGRRLGYVFHDLVWLILREVGPAFVADLIVAHVTDEPHEWRGEKRWLQIGTVGPALLPALENLAQRTFDEGRDWDIPHHLPAAIVAAGGATPVRVEEMVGRLLESERPRETMIALKIARRMPLPGVLDRLFEAHVQRAIEMNDRTDADARGDTIARYSVSMDALKRAVSASSAWLEAQVATETRVEAVEQVVWCLVDDTCVVGADARPIWVGGRDHVLAVLPRNSKALVAALGHFDAVEQRDRLDSVSPTREDWMSSRLLKTRARIDPEAALEQVRTSTDEYGWSASDWWLPELYRYDAKRLSEALRENVAGSTDPGNDLVHYYYNQPELMDEVTLELVLDEATERLRDYNSTNMSEDAKLHPPRRIIGFLSKLSEPFQFDCLRRRAGTALEHELTRFAITRPGRSSRMRDTEGNECERALAMIDGGGYSALVVEQLRRNDGFGREDGYISAHWTDDERVSSVLAGDAVDDGADGYRQVIRMQALAIHSGDAAIERMLRLDAPVFVAPAEMRSSSGRELTAIRTRVAALLATGDPTDLGVAADFAGFLADPEDARPLIAPLLDPSTSTESRHSIIATMKALGFYDASVLPIVRATLTDRHDDQAWFLTSYLAEYGDAAARDLVIAWLDGLDISSLSTARDPTLRGLRSHDDSRDAVLPFYRRMSERGHQLLDTEELEILARGGDDRALEMLLNAAYRGPDGFGIGPVGGILYLLESDPDEAFFAATRLLARHRKPEAVRLLFKIDKDRACDELLHRFRGFPPSLRAEIGRNVRAHVPHPAIEQILGALAISGEAAGRETAAELGGWMPTGIDLPWLSDLANDEDVAVRNAGIDAKRRRGFESAALGHLEAMVTSSKPLQWARMLTIFDLVDPRFLWTRGDPLSFGPFLEDAPYEFWVEARRLHQKREKTVGDGEKKADSKAD